MKALQFTAYGVAPSLGDVATPAPGPGEILIRVAGAALNPLDVKLGAGFMKDYFPITFPSTVGTDVSGTVESLGADVTKWGVGERVVVRTEPTSGGAVAEFAVARADLVAAAPVSVPLEVASGVATAAATALQAVRDVAGITRGQKVLVHGGSGGVGSLIIQLARSAGAHVVATASSSGVDLVRRLGAEEVIDYTAADFRRVVSDVDVVIDAIGGETEVASLDVLKPGGLLIGLNMPPDFDRATARGVRAEFFAHASDASRLTRAIAAIDGGLELVVDRVVPLHQAVEAFEYLAGGHAKGKVIIRP